MSKTTDTILLLPGEISWEIWTASPGSPPALHSHSETARAAELADLPPGDVHLLFPVRSLTSLPVKVTSNDDSLFEDLAALHAERLGLRPDPMAGQLTDVFPITRAEDSTALLTVLLKAPTEGDLPPRGPKGFDLSARALPAAGETITVWKEFGRWVFALHHEGKLLHCQATPLATADPDEALAREIRLTILQLSLQSIEYTPTRILLWSSAPRIDPTALRETLHLPVETIPRPDPVMPAPASKLLPADVRAARRAAARRRTIQLGIAAVAALYLGAIGWAAWDLWKIRSDTAKLTRLAEAAAPEREAYATHIAKWDELAPAINLNNCPVNILSRVARSIPPNSGLRLRTAEISAQEVKLIGEAPQAPPVNQFDLALSKNNDLQFYWQRPEPNQTTRGWEFVFTGSTTPPP